MALILERPCAMDGDTAEHLMHSDHEMAFVMKGQEHNHR